MRGTRLASARPYGQWVGRVFLAASALGALSIQDLGMQTAGGRGNQYPFTRATARAVSKKVVLAEVVSLGGVPYFDIYLNLSTMGGAGSEIKHWLLRNSPTFMRTGRFVDLGTGLSVWSGRKYVADRLHGTVFQRAKNTLAINVTTLLGPHPRD